MPCLFCPGEGLFCPRDGLCCLLLLLAIIPYPVGAGVGEAPKDYTKPRQTFQSPRKTIQIPRRLYKDINIRQSPPKVYKDITILDKTHKY